VGDSATTSAEPERWLPIAGYEGLYSVSDLGNVRSFHAGSGKGKRGGQLKPWPDRNGYLMVCLYKDGEVEHRAIHQLVAEAFIGPCPPGQQVRHGPNGKLDNRAAQLCHGTPAQQKEDMLRDGTVERGEDRWSAKLTWAKASQIRERVAAGERQRALAREFGVTPTVICRIVNGKGWIPSPPAFGES
jgi:hypothetical protein